jgi:hypothetical protein
MSISLRLILSTQLECDKCHERTLNEEFITKKSFEAARTRVGSFTAAPPRDCNPVALAPAIGLISSNQESSPFDLAFIDTDLEFQALRVSGGDERNMRGERRGIVINREIDAFDVLGV